MTYTNILYSGEARVALVRMNRPQALNALNSTVLRELIEDTKEAVGDRCAVAVRFAASSPARADEGLRIKLLSATRKNQPVAGATVITGSSGSSALAAALYWSAPGLLPLDKAEGVVLTLERTLHGGNVAIFADIGGAANAYLEWRQSAGEVRPERVLAEFELNYLSWLVDREIRQLINESASDLEIEDAAIAAGMMSQFGKLPPVDPTKVKVIWTTPPYFDYNWTVRGDLDPQLRDRLFGGDTPEMRAMATAAVKGFRMGPLFTPPSLEGTIVRPGSVGGGFCLLIGW